MHRAGQMAPAAMAGRASELQLLRDAAAAVSRGERRMVQVRGEAGIGKTRLLTELLSELPVAGYTVLQGRATELESDVPFAPILEAFAGYPELGLDDVAAQMVSSGDRWQLYRRVTTALDDIGADGPVALVLDDMHWADPVTLESLEHSIRRPPRRPHLLVLGMRPGVIGEHLLDAQRMTNGAAVVIKLKPLDRVAAEVLMPTAATQADRARIFVESGGNPMMIEELSRAGVEVVVPGAVTDHVQVELRRSTPAAAELLQFGALYGDPFDIDMAGAAAGLNSRQVIGAIDDLAERSLVRPAGGRQFEFRHPVVRSALLAAMPPGRRLAWHGRIARVLADNGAPLPARARHLAYSATAGDRDAAAVLRAAAALVRPQSPVIAADWLLAALHADPTADPATRAVLAETLVDAGRLGQALEVAEGTLAAPAAASMRSVLVAASVERLLGRHVAARRRLVAALLAEKPEGAEAARLLADLAVSAYESGAFDEFGPFAERALDVPAADPVVRAVSSLLVSVAHLFTGAREVAAVECDEGVSIIAALSDAELATHAELLTAVPWALLAHERLTDILTTGRRTAEAARCAGNSSAAVAQQLAVLVALGLLGRIRECVEAADRAEQSARMTANDQIVQWALWMRAWSLLERGNVQTANIVAAESVELARRLDDSSQVTVATAVLGATLVAAGKTAKGRPMIEAYDLDPGWVCRWAPVLVEADLALGDVPAGRAHADRAAALARRLGLAGPRSYAARAQGLVALAEGDPESARLHATDSIMAAQSIGAMLEVGRGRLLLGRALAGSDRSAAIQELEAAGGLADEAGARRVHDEAVRELRKLGKRVGRGGRRASGGDDMGALSDREREIAGLVAQGYTNKDIAAQLFLSDKTVESHLSRTFAKLDVRSRAALAARFGAAQR